MIQKKIKLLIMDVDGTLTDGQVHLSNNGELFKSFNVKDGLGIKVLLQANDIKSVLITGRNSSITSLRANELNISKVYQGIEEKNIILSQLSCELNIKYESIAYIGDDINDLSAMNLVGYRGCPCDAVEEIKQISDYVCRNKGGDGAVREFIAKIIELNNTYNNKI